MKHERIWLQTEHEATGEMTWCEDKINDDDVEYVRADKVADLEKTIEICSNELLRLEKRDHELDMHIIALRANMSKSVLRRLDIQLQNKPALKTTGCKCDDNFIDDVYVTKGMCKCGIHNDHSHCVTCKGIVCIG